MACRSSEDPLDIAATRTDAPAALDCGLVTVEFRQVRVAAAVGADRWLVAEVLKGLRAVDQSDVKPVL